MLLWQRHIRQLSYQKSNVCVVNLRSAIFGDQRVKGFRGKGDTGIETVFSQFNGLNGVTTHSTLE